MDINRIKLLYHTVKYLKPTQVYYFLRNKLIRKKIKEKIYTNFSPIVWKNGFKYENSYFNKDNKFVFLNLSHSFFHHSQP